MKLDWAAFREILKNYPLLHDVVTAAMAKRLADRTAHLSVPYSRSKVRTITILAAGDREMPPLFVNQLRSVLKRHKGPLLLTSSDAARLASLSDRDHLDLAACLNSQELSHDLLVFVADRQLTSWTELAIRQSDEVLIVLEGASPAPLGSVERFAFAIYPPSDRRLVRIHPRRTHAVAGMQAFLQARPAALHHHVALHDDQDIQTLSRFLCGRAIGFVAGGGAALGIAHIGIFQALLEHGIKFDFLGGTSAGLRDYGRICSRCHRRLNLGWNSRHFRQESWS